MKILGKTSEETLGEILGISVGEVPREILEGIAKNFQEKSREKLYETFCDNI